MKDILVLVATGFEDTELISSINIFDREGLSFDLVSIENLLEVKAQRFAKVETIKIKDIDQDEYKSVFLPGGSGHKLLLESNEVEKILKHFHSNNRIISAICASPSFEKAKVIGDKKYTAFPGDFATGKNKQDKAFVVDGKLITGKDFEATQQFAFALVDVIKNN